MQELPLRHGGKHLLIPLVLDMGEERANCGGDLRHSAFRNRFVQQMFQAIEPQHSDFGRSVAVLDIVGKRRMPLM